MNLAVAAMIVQNPADLFQLFDALRLRVFRLRLDSKESAKLKCDISKQRIFDFSPCLISKLHARKDMIR